MDSNVQNILCHYRAKILSQKSKRSKMVHNLHPTLDFLKLLKSLLKRYWVRHWVHYHC